MALFLTVVGAWLSLLAVPVNGGLANFTTDPYVARIGFFNYGWEIDGIIFNDDRYTQVQEAMAPLATLLFNERRGDILPVLGTLGACNKNLTIPYTCASGGNPRIAFTSILEISKLAYFPHFM